MSRVETRSVPRTPSAGSTQRALEVRPLLGERIIQANQYFRQKSSAKFQPDDQKRESGPFLLNRKKNRGGSIERYRKKK